MEAIKLVASNLKTNDNFFLTASELLLPTGLKISLNFVSILLAISEDFQKVEFLQKFGRYVCKVSGCRLMVFCEDSASVGLFLFFSFVCKYLF